jgi:hypothetical protein
MLPLLLFWQDMKGAGNANADVAKAWGPKLLCSGQLNLGSAIPAVATSLQVVEGVAKHG